MLFVLFFQEGEQVYNQRKNHDDKHHDVVNRHTDSLLHSREIGGKPPQMQASPYDNTTQNWHKQQGGDERVWVCQNKGLKPLVGTGDCQRIVQDIREFDKIALAVYIIKNGDACNRATASVAGIIPPSKLEATGRAFLCSFSYFFRKERTSITSPTIAMTSIAFS